MKRTFLNIIAGVFLAAPFFASASPTAGCADLSPPGTWSSKCSELGDRGGFQMGDGLTYAIHANGPSQVWADGTGQWDWLERYNSAWISLTNAPGSSWYSPNDTNLSFEIDLPYLVVKSRGPLGLWTNGEPAYLEMEVGAHVGRLILLATYAGTPNLTWVPQTPESWGYTVATAPLRSARICLSYAGGPATSPLTIRGLFNESPRVELSWASFTNRLYQFQTCSDLLVDAWTDAGSPIIGLGTSQRALDAIGRGATQRFYRLLEFP